MLTHHEDYTDHVTNFLSPDSPLAGFFAAAPAAAPVAIVAAAVATKTDLDWTQLARTLLGHQAEGVEYILDRRRVVLGDEMGVGKTAQAIAAVLFDGRCTLAIVPPALTHNWRNEIRAFAPQLRVEILTGTKPYLPGSADVYIIGDAVLAKWAGLHKVKYIKRDSTEGEKDAVNGMLTKLAVCNIVVDEAHRFKTWKAQRTRAALAFAETLPGDALRLVMTGTLSVNRAEEVVQPIRIAGVDHHFGGWFEMLNYYAPKIDRYGTRGSAHLDELHRIMVERFYLRRERADVLTLPGKGRSLVAMGMTGKAATEYLAAQDDLIAYVRGTKGRKAAEVASKAEALVLLTTLRRLIAMAKLAGTIEYVRDLVDQGEQVFVGTWHADTTEALVKAFADVNSVRVAGDDTTPAKQAAVEAFQAGTARVLVGNIKAAGVGITLTAARHVVVAELPWTPGDLEQLEDRLDRIGQTRKVVSHVLLGTNGIPTVDERLMGMLNDKATATGMINRGEAGTIIDDESITAALLNSYAEDAA